MIPLNLKLQHGIMNKIMVSMKTYISVISLLLSINLFCQNLIPDLNGIYESENGVKKNIIYEDYYGRSIAFLVGISNYNEFASLESSNYDIKRVKDYLISEAGFDLVITLTNNHATIDSIRYYFEDYLPNKVKTNDRFLFYYTGHGTQRFLGDNTRGYLVLKDSKVNEWSSMISMGDFEEWDQNLHNSIHSLYILDCCFSGLAGNQVKHTDQEYYLNDLNMKGHHLITAGTANQYSYSSLKNWGGSLFTHLFIEGASGNADSETNSFSKDYVVSTSEIFEYIRRRIAQEKAKNKNINQSPQFSDLINSTGEFFFINKSFVPAVQKDDDKMKNELIIKKNIILSNKPKLYRKYDNDATTGIFVGPNNFMFSEGGKIKIINFENSKVVKTFDIKCSIAKFYQNTGNDNTVYGITKTGNIISFDIDGFTFEIQRSSSIVTDIFNSEYLDFCYQITNNKFLTNAKYGGFEMDLCIFEGNPLHLKERLQRRDESFSNGTLISGEGYTQNTHNFKHSTFVNGIVNDTVIIPVSFYNYHPKLFNTRPGDGGGGYSYIDAKPIAYNNKNELIAFTDAYAIYFFHPKYKTLNLISEPLPYKATSLEFSPDGFLLYCGSQSYIDLDLNQSNADPINGDETIISYDVYSHRKIQSYFGHTGSVKDIKFIGLSDYFISIDTDDITNIWKAGINRPLYSLHSSNIELPSRCCNYEICISNDFKYFATLNDNGIIIWSLE